MKGTPLFIQPWESDPVVLLVRTSQHHFPQVSPHLHTPQIRGKSSTFPAWLFRDVLQRVRGSRAYFGAFVFGLFFFFCATCRLRDQDRCDAASPSLTGGVTRVRQQRALCRVYQWCMEDSHLVFPAVLDVDLGVFSVLASWPALFLAAVFLFFANVGRFF